MPELNESRVREIIRDEITVMQIPERLAKIEEQNREINLKIDRLDKFKADKSDIERLENKIGLHKEQTNRDNKIMIGLIITVILLVIAALIKK